MIAHHVPVARKYMFGVDLRHVAALQGKMYQSNRFVWAATCWAGHAENFTGGIGVMADDLVAGILAAVVLWVGAISMGYAL